MGRDLQLVATWLTGHVRLDYTVVLDVEVRRSISELLGLIRNDVSYLDREKAVDKL